MVLEPKALPRQVVAFASLGYLFTAAVSGALCSRFFWELSTFLVLLARFLVFCQIALCRYFDAYFLIFGSGRLLVPLCILGR